MADSSTCQGHEPADSSNWPMIAYYPFGYAYHQPGDMESRHRYGYQHISKDGTPKDGSRFQNILSDSVRSEYEYRHSGSQTMKPEPQMLASNQGNQTLADATDKSPVEDDPLKADGSVHRWEEPQKQAKQCTPFSLPELKVTCHQQPVGSCQADDPNSVEKEKSPFSPPHLEVPCQQQPVSSCQAADLTAVPEEEKKQPEKCHFINVDDILQGEVGCIVRNEEERPESECLSEEAKLQQSVPTVSVDSDQIPHKKNTCPEEEEGPDIKENVVKQRCKRKSTPPKKHEAYRRNIYEKMTQVLLQKAHELEMKTGAHVTMRIEPPWSQGKILVYPLGSRKSPELGKKRSRTMPIVTSKEKVGDENSNDSLFAEPSPESEDQPCNKGAFFSNILETILLEEDTNIFDKPSASAGIRNKKNTVKKNMESTPSDDDEFKEEVETSEAELGEPPQTEVPAGQTGVEQFSCELCTKAFPRQYSLNRHIIRQHGGKPFKCKFCDKTFTRKTERKSHVDALHSKERPFDCVECGKKFGTRPEMLKHVSAVHLQERPFDCPYCGKKFKNRWAMKMHIRALHTNERPHECQYCVKTFTDKGAVTSHIRLVHADNRPTEKLYQCHLCGKILSQSCKLKLHISTVHEGEQPHQCQHCGKRFGDKSNMIAHVNMVHKQLRPHMCQYCGKSFSARVKMKRHISSVHEQAQPYQCQYCDRKLVDRTRLKLHISVVHNHERPHMCQHCGKTFGEASNMRKHIKKVHKQ